MCVNELLRRSLVSEDGVSDPVGGHNDCPMAISKRYGVAACPTVSARPAQTRCELWPQELASDSEVVLRPASGWLALPG
jgi:hypothetical protein